MNILQEVSNTPLLLDHVGTVRDRNRTGGLCQVRQVSGAEVRVTIE